MNHQEAIKNITTLNTTWGGTITINNKDYVGVANDDMEEKILEEVLNRLAKKPVFEYKCHNCGGSLELEENKHIFKCPYCNSAYAVGTNMVNDKGD